MFTIIEAVFEGGVFRPIHRVELREGTHVDIVVPQASEASAPKEVARLLSQLAAKSSRGDAEATSRDHDRLLYGP